MTAMSTKPCMSSVVVIVLAALGTREDRAEGA